MVRCASCLVAAAASSEKVTQSFGIAATDGLMRVLGTAPFNGVQVYLPRPCSQIPFSVPAITRTLDAQGRVLRAGWFTEEGSGYAVCIDVIRPEETDMNLIYGNSQKDTKLTRTWRELEWPEFKAEFCPSLGLLRTAASGEKASFDVSTRLLTNDEAFTFKVASLFSLRNSSAVQEPQSLRMTRANSNAPHQADLEASHFKVFDGPDEASIVQRLGAAHCMRVRFRSLSFAPLRTEKLETEYYLPAWGDAARVTEAYNMLNEAAPVIGHYKADLVKEMYGRTLGTMRAGPPVLIRNSVALGFITEFPPHTFNHQFYDRIGNITTSEVVSIEDDGQLMVVYPRHPLLGQWRASWTLRYELPQSNLVQYTTPSEGLVVIPCRTAIAGFWADKRVITVILPPFSKLKSFELSAPPAKEPKITFDRQWLDLLPTRTVVQVELQNSPNHRHEAPGLLVIRFGYNRTFTALSHAAWFLIPIAAVWGGLRLFELKKF